MNLFSFRCGRGWLSYVENECASAYVSVYVCVCVCVCKCGGGRYLSNERRQTKKIGGESKFMKFELTYFLNGPF